MVNDTIKRLRELHEAATPGLWDATWGGTNGRHAMLHIHRAGASHVPGGDRAGCNAHLIAAMHSALPALLDAVDELQSVIDSIALERQCLVPDWPSRIDDIEQNAASALAALDEVT